MTAPGEPETSRPAPGTRRAARAMHDEAERRARAEATAQPVTTRRAARAAELFDPDAVHARHARPRTWTRAALVAGLAVAAALLVGSSAALTAMVIPPAETVEATMGFTAEPPAVAQLPVPRVEQSPVATDLCAVPDFAAALQSGDDQAAVAAAGGGEAFRAAVVAGSAGCVDLGDSARVWTVVDKLRPASPIDYRPSALVMPEGVRNIDGGALRADAAAALTSLVTAARDAGAGEIGLASAFRSYETQQLTYARHVAVRGQQADQVSARPGHSEHQLGLGVDVVPCAGACGSLDDLAGTAQGQWITEHAWEHGWIVRYVEGATPVTGYLPEPWHLRYVGAELARAYHEGGWRSLEEFFGLPPAPDYAH
ncbi:M15 family metallopeptidase [Microbacterium sp. HD4P20]|uniref:M15 family metallopeptidase n=1 Tax=Microbacterium sp. HD4P20 TaxID=2864874 RepID=UPI0020A4F0D0|nr:M15 family metallopeptidase [Microbacterium sp. HD4P20]MCP2638508.1 M15 family metallopeptidase [Microbacterium sp. HD4P20]